MAIPDFQRIMLPLLKFAADQQEHPKREAIECLAKQFNLTVEERKELLPSGQQMVFDNRVGWAITYLKKAGLLESPKRSFFRITQRGVEILKQNPPEINVKFLKQFPEFIEFKEGPKEDKKETIISEVEETTQETPEETLENSYQKIRQYLAQDLLIQVKNCSPNFFEKLVIELLVKMGYGGSRKDAGEAIGKRGDEGIDGIIKEDKLGLDTIYLQAKRWESTVGRPEIQKFAGALQMQQARKGVFITTSNFSKDALEGVSKIPSKIILIDGERLAQLMIDNNVGVSSINSYEIKKINTDYFTEE